jgi:hypothetical protein
MEIKALAAIAQFALDALSKMALFTESGAV